MTWRRVTPHARKAYWDGPGWPTEVSQQTRDNAATAGWDAAGWAACRNTAWDPAVELWLDQMPAFTNLVPAIVVAEMVDRCERPDDAVEMLDSLAVGVPPCMAWLFARHYAAKGSALRLQAAAVQMGFTPQQMVGWWRTRIFDQHEYLDQLDTSALMEEIAPWIERCGPNAYLWVLLDYTLSGGKMTTRADPARNEAELRDRVEDCYFFRLPEDLNDHSAPELERSEFAKGHWDDGWVIPPGGHGAVWTKDGWPDEVPQDVREAAASAGWTDRDWVGFDTKYRNDSMMHDLLWQLPIFAEPVGPELVDELATLHGPDVASDVLALAAAGVPVGFASLAQSRFKVVYPHDDMSATIHDTWALVNHRWGLSYAEAVGWLLAGYLDIGPSGLSQEGTTEKVAEKIGPWQDRLGSTAYLWVLAGLSQDEAEKTAAQPGWDETALRTMVALNGVVLPPGV